MIIKPKNTNLANQGTQHCVFAFRRFPHEPWEITTVKKSAGKAKPEFPTENRYRMRMQTVHVLPNPFGIVWQNEAHNTTRSNQLSEGTTHRVTNETSLFNGLIHMQSADNILTVSHGHYVHSCFKNEKQLTSQRRLTRVRSPLTRQRRRAKNTSSVTLHLAKVVHLNVALDGTKLAKKDVVFSCVSGGSHGQYSVSWSPIMETLCNLSLSDMVAPVPQSVSTYKA